MATVTDAPRRAPFAGTAPSETAPSATIGGRESRVASDLPPSTVRSREHELERIRVQQLEASALRHGPRSGVDRHRHRSPGQ